MDGIVGGSLCPAPFIDSGQFNDSLGCKPFLGTSLLTFALTSLPIDLEGRLCQKITKDVQCCLPCPVTEWIYADSFHRITVLVEWAACLSVLCCMFLMVSWAILPVAETKRHYLTVCLTAGVLLMSVSSFCRGYKGTKSFYLTVTAWFCRTFGSKPARMF